jgi:TolB-like protein/class 3 adenylate cyclase
LTGERVERRLAAILAADVAGYSRLMGLNEEGTLAQLKAIRKALVDPTIAAHRGRIVKTTGDGMLVEFASAVDAARCAVDVQRGMERKNTHVSQDIRIEFRIGIHVGDIIIDDNDIFGDGVNIAARLEGIAEPGGVCISDDAQRQIRGKVDIGFDDIGLQTLKNITEPMRAWRMQIGIASASTLPRNVSVATSQALALPDKPSIAVLPFQNMSGDPDQEYFADGLVDDIITGLSRFKALFVIARNSSFTYKGKPVDIKQVGRELGVRYVLEGSVRKAGPRLRITGQLIDVATAGHLWADRFEGALEDIFDLQDKVTQQVIGAIAPELDRAEIERASRKSVGNIDAVTAYYRGLPHANFPTSPEKNDAAMAEFEYAMAADPSFVPAYGGAASCLGWRRANRWPGDIATDNAKILHLAARVKELDADDALTLCVLGFNLFWFQLDYDGGAEMIERAIRSNPNCARAYNVRGLLRAWGGGSDAAVTDFEQAMRLSPRDPFNYNAMLGLALAHHNGGRHSEAVEWADRSLRAFPPSFLVGMMQAIVCYVGAGKLEQAQTLMTECLRRSPGWRRSTAIPPDYISPELRAEFMEAFTKAGLPD